MGKPLIALAMLLKFVCPASPKLDIISSREVNDRMAFASVLVFLKKSNDSVK